MAAAARRCSDLIDDVFVAAFDNAALAPLEDQARFDLADARRAWRPAGLHHRFLRGRSADLSRRRHRQARRLRHGQRPRRRRGAAALSVLRRHHRGRLDRRPAAPDRRAPWRRGARTAGVQIVTGDTKVVHKGACDKLFITTTGIGVIREGVSSAPIGRGPATRSWSTGCSATTARRSSARVATWRSTRRSRATAPPFTG